MEKRQSKAELRAHLERETQRYLRDGGQVQQVPAGISGKDPGEPPLFLNRRLFAEPPGTRTPVPEVVAAIEQRRQAMLKRTPAPKRSRLPRPRKKVIYDDFGEPLRRVWIDD